MERGEELLLQFLGAGKAKLQGGGAHGSFSHCAREEMGAESLGAMAGGAMERVAHWWLLLP